MPRTMIAFALVLACVGGAAPAFASRPSLHVTPTSVVSGHRVRLSGSAGGCPVGDTVTLISRAFSPRHSFAGVPAVFATVRPSGRYAVMTRIPRTRRPGRYTITGRCGGGNFGVVAHLRVRRATADLRQS